MFCMSVPDGGSIGLFQLRAYTCAVGSLYVSYIFGFDVSFYKTCVGCYAVNEGAPRLAIGYVNPLVPRTKNRFLQDMTMQYV